MKLRTLTLALASLPATALLGSPAAFAEDEERRTEILEYRLADLAQPEGVDRLRSEVWRASMRVCHRYGVRGASEWRDQRRCADAAFEAAIGHLDRRIAELQGHTLASTATVRLALVAPVD